MVQNIAFKEFIDLELFVAREISFARLQRAISYAEFIAGRRFLRKLKLKTICNQVVLYGAR